MTSSPGARRAIRAGFVLLDPATGTISRVLEFPLNPESLVRSLEPGPPTESAIEPREVISFSLTLDATDALERRDPQAAADGILPLLSAVEMLMYGSAGSLPLVVFVWGKRRILPVRLTSLVITEQDFDTKLNPILARVAVTMLSLRDADLPLDSPARALWKVQLEVLQQLAASAANGTLDDLGLGAAGMTRTGETQGSR
jgi:hypothetical protein